MNKRNIVLSIAAGLLGGALSNSLLPIAAHAQAQPQPPEEIRAQRFTLVNPEGVSFGSFSFDPAGRPQILLRDKEGHDVWKFVGEHSAVQPGSSGRFHSK